MMKKRRLSELVHIPRKSTYEGEFQRCQELSSDLQLHSSTYRLPDVASSYPQERERPRFLRNRTLSAFDSGTGRPRKNENNEGIVTIAEHGIRSRTFASARDFSQTSAPDLISDDNKKHLPGKGLSKMLHTQPWINHDNMPVTRLYSEFGVSCDQIDSLEVKTESVSLESLDNNCNTCERRPPQLQIEPSIDPGGGTSIPISTHVKLIDLKQENITGEQTSISLSAGVFQNETGCYKHDIVYDEEMINSASSESSSSAEKDENGTIRHRHKLDSHQLCQILKAKGLGDPKKNKPSVGLEIPRPTSLPDIVLAFKASHRPTKPSEIKILKSRAKREFEMASSKARAFCEMQRNNNMRSASANWRRIYHHMNVISEDIRTNSGDSMEIDEDGRERSKFNEQFFTRIRTWIKEVDNAHRNIQQKHDPSMPTS